MMPLQTRKASCVMFDEMVRGLEVGRYRSEKVDSRLI